MKIFGWDCQSDSKIHLEEQINENYQKFLKGVGGMALSDVNVSYEVTIIKIQW